MQQGFLEAGQAVERNLARVAQRQGWVTVEATKQQDMREHWDVCLVSPTERLRVDVKARKKESRSNSTTQDQWVWLELHGVNPGNAGWLYGGLAELIAFERTDDFVLVERKRLIRRVEELVPRDSKWVDWASDAKYKLYGRKDRADIITMIEMHHLVEIAWDIWQK
jgi:hypothetical protein